MKLNATNFPLLALLIRLWGHFGRRRKRQLGFLVLLMLVSGGFEVVSLGAVLPFLSILAAPDLVFNHPIVAEWDPPHL